MFPFHPQGHCRLAASSRPGSVSKHLVGLLRGSISNGKDGEGGEEGGEGGRDAVGQGTWLTEKGPAFPSGVTLSSLSERLRSVQGGEFLKLWLLFSISDLV